MFYPCMFLSTSKPVPLDEKKKGQVKIVLCHVCVYVVFSLNTWLQNRRVIWHIMRCMWSTLHVHAYASWNMNCGLEKRACIFIKKVSSVTLLCNMHMGDKAVYRGQCSRKCYTVYSECRGQCATRINMLIRQNMPDTVLVPLLIPKQPCPLKMHLGI